MAFSSGSIRKEADHSSFIEIEQYLETVLRDMKDTRTSMRDFHF